MASSYAVVCGLAVACTNLWDAHQEIIRQDKVPWQVRTAQLSACLPTAADCPNIEWRLRYVALLLAALSGQWSRLSVTEPPLAALSIRNARGKIVYSWDAA